MLMELKSKRAGCLVPDIKLPEPGDKINESIKYFYFLPSPLSEIKINMDDEMTTLIISATKQLTLLANTSQYLPIVSLIINLYQQKEAVLSTQIEGSHVTMNQILTTNISYSEKSSSIKEVNNTCLAYNKAIILLEKLPICVRLFNEIHNIILHGVRGQQDATGELKNKQN